MGESSIAGQVISIVLAVVDDVVAPLASIHRKGLVVRVCPVGTATDAARVRPMPAPVGSARTTVPAGVRRDADGATAPKGGSVDVHV